MILGTPYSRFVLKGILVTPPPPCIHTLFSKVCWLLPLPHHTGNDGAYIYINDLLRLDISAKSGSTTSVDPRLTPVSTPLQLHKRKQHLHHHPDHDFTTYIIQGIQYGFHIGAKSPAFLVSTNKNMSSAQQHPEIIDDYQKKEIEQSNIRPFSSLSAQRFILIGLRLSQKNISVGDGAS